MGVPAALSAMQPMVSMLPRIARAHACWAGANRAAWTAAQQTSPSLLLMHALVSHPAAQSRALSPYLFRSFAVLAEVVSLIFSIEFCDLRLLLIWSSDVHARCTQISKFI